MPKTGQILKKSSIYQRVIKKHVGLGCIDKMTIVALQAPFYKANERGCRHLKSKTSQRAKPDLDALFFTGAFPHPVLDVIVDDKV